MPATIDRSESVSRYFNLVRLSPTDIEEESFIINKNVIFDPAKLDISCSQKKIITKAIVEKRKLVADMSNSNIVRTVQFFFVKKRKKSDGRYKLWADVDSELLMNKKLKLSYSFCFC